MILVTGAGGKTGQAIIAALQQRPEPVRAWVRRADQIQTVEALGAAEAIVGDVQSPLLWAQATKDMAAIYHICPNMYPHETTVGAMALQAARHAGISRFVYHSVLHPQTQAMPHHWNKLRVEEWLFESGLNFTILQPAAYMQNVLAGWQRIVETGIYAVPYPAETRLSMVDLNDVAEVAATVLTQPGHEGAIYELAGPAALTQTEVVAFLAQALSRSVQFQETPLAEWEESARRAGLSDYAVETLLAMFRYYAQHGFWGNSHVLRWLLGREATTFAEFLQRQLSQPTT